MSAYVLTAQLRGHEKVNITTLAFSPCGSYLASGSEDGQIILWKVDGDMTRRLYVHTLRTCVFVIIWHPFKEAIIVGCAGGTVLQLSDWNTVSTSGYFFMDLTVCSNPSWFDHLL
jgi:WD40 repeat protein